MNTKSLSLRIAALRGGDVRQLKLSPPHALATSVPSGMASSDAIAEGMATSDVCTDTLHFGAHTPELFFPGNRPFHQASGGGKTYLPAINLQVNLLSNASLD